MTTRATPAVAVPKPALADYVAWLWQPEDGPLPREHRTYDVVPQGAWRSESLAKVFFTNGPTPATDFVAAVVAGEQHIPAGAVAYADFALPPEDLVLWRDFQVALDTSVSDRQDIDRLERFAQVALLCLRHEWHKPEGPWIERLAGWATLLANGLMVHGRSLPRSHVEQLWALLGALGLRDGGPLGIFDDEDVATARRLLDEAGPTGAAGVADQSSGEPAGPDELATGASAVADHLDLARRAVSDAQDEWLAAHQGIERAERAVPSARQRLNELRARLKQREGQLASVVSGRLPSARSLTGDYTSLRREADQLLGSGGDRLVSRLQEANQRLLFAGRAKRELASDLQRSVDVANTMASRTDEVDEALAGVERARAEARAVAATIDDRLAAVAKEIRERAADLPAALAPWRADQWALWTPAARIPRHLRIGEHRCEGALCRDSIAVPALVRFPEDRGLVVSHTAPRDRAEAAASSVLLRLLASMPPASFQLSFIDPIGLGGTFAPFLHLQELDPSVFAGRVATQPSAIEELLDLTVVHIETVTQQYLRSTYATLREYNAAAGEVAERFRFLIVAGYPSAFDSRTASKLRSILQRGPRCGVFAIVLASEDVDVHDVPPADRLAADAIHVALRADGTAYSQASAAEPLELAVDQPPELVVRDDGAPQTLFGQILVGTAVLGRELTSKAVTQERAFELMARASGWRHGAPAPASEATVVPSDPGTWWQRDSDDSIEVPIGRSGARDVCSLRFDSRASSAALVVGAPGMGKTTLLHAVILGACLQYSPDELELYLLDAKQGVEFKVYEDLPHARAVAIRNEREFGVSVLEGLRAELDRRASLIKRVTGGAEVDLPGYRRASGDRLPRILLVADEFHELFERVDRLGQRAAELLDDLIRQGRSYGIHVLLGSQTLDGTDALPKHVLQLTQTRIAFQCREQDAAVVMREDNREVLSLTGPGDGLFNPDRGAPAANERFQGTLIEPRERVALVAALREHARGRFDRQPIVFDGDEAFPLDDQPVSEFASNGPHLTLRLGEPCAISDPIRVAMPRRAGANLAAVVDDVTARALTHVALASTHGTCRATVLDLTGEDDHVRDAFAATDEVTYSRRRRAGETLNALVDLVEGRLELDEYRAPGELLIVVGLKGLRNPDDPIAGDRSFVDLLETILRDGPEVGVHTVLIADTMSTLQRRLPPSAVGECGIRIATRMSREDSERLLDDDAAAGLRPHQAVVMDETENALVRVRCYQPAGPRWTAALAQQPDIAGLEA